MRGLNINAPMFLSIGCFLLSWRIAPQVEDDWRLWLLTALIALGGTLGVVACARKVHQTRGPRPARWTPPMWLVAWLAVGFLAWQFGTPHLRLSYGPQECVYVGWNGAESHGSYPCPLFQTLPLRL